ncbi:MAG: hypothetical protein A2750_04300 [Candidatus Yanofskybacteria bacterium RIFCSPHIGHO2_01_FULL_45_42]|uniref:Uncharacterized protein n=2 Tax=Candidatus Yanofskyibacteriota TaxID=1752733 RepID=A0A1F8FK50_9BACT|nr:MAG: hypothetical protein A2750_04300 [Candidatus Yanofskybacteria bacterium RIFCSPHIGHO2_01_FULL_45_42]OGN13483.1 MAG: hypothetical protein A3J47_03955 [Candidatus Yanofskybacteria bacterium RIFCSPHIGHO2_02_FULL_43_22]
MESNRHHFYFAITIVAILATGGFAMLEVANTMTELVLIEESFYGVVRSGDVRLSAEINRSIQDVDLDFLDDLDEEFNEIDEGIDIL